MMIFLKKIICAILNVQQSNMRYRLLHAPYIKVIYSIVKLADAISIELLVISCVKSFLCKSDIR